MQNDNLSTTCGGGDFEITRNAMIRSFLQDYPISQIWLRVEKVSQRFEVTTVASSTSVLDLYDEFVHGSVLRHGSCPYV